MIVAGDASGRVHFLQLVEADETKPSHADVKVPLLSREQQSTYKPNGYYELSALCYWILNSILWAAPLCKRQFGFHQISQGQQEKHF